MYAGLRVQVPIAVLLSSCLTVAAPLQAASVAVASQSAASRTKVAKAARPTGRAATKAVRAIEPPESDLAPELLALAEFVQQGTIACELGASVAVHADVHHHGYFDVHLKQQHFRMVPVATTTGAIRLEDARAGAVWLQLANKSMLMSQKHGQRLADACITPQQREAAQRLQGQPGILDTPTPLAAQAAEPAASAATQ